MGAESLSQPGRAWGRAASPRRLDLSGQEEGIKQAPDQKGPPSPPAPCLEGDSLPSPSARRPHLHQLSGNPREAHPECGTAQHPEGPRARLPRHLRATAPLAEPRDERAGRRSLPLPVGAWRPPALATGSERASFIHPRCQVPAPPAPAIASVEGPPPPSREIGLQAPHPCPHLPRPQGHRWGWAGGRTGWGQVPNQQVPLPSANGPQFLHPGQGGGAGIC